MVDDAGKVFYKFEQIDEEKMDEMVEIFNSIPEDVPEETRLLLSLAGKDGNLSGDILSIEIDLVALRKRVKGKTKSTILQIIEQMKKEA